MQMPLRETRGPQRMAPDGTLLEGRSVFYYQPFTTTDHLNWKHHTPAYSEKPQAMIDLLELVFQTHKPTWVYCKQLLLTFFITEEQMRIVTEARRRRGGAGLGVAGVADWAGGTLSLRRQRRRELSVCAMAVLWHRRGLWGSEPTSRRGPSKAGELGACPLLHQAFQKPLPRRRLLKGLVHQRTGTQLPRDRKRGAVCSGTSGPPAIKSGEQAASSVRGACKALWGSGYGLDG
ncbi:hypothetical protein QTO34_004685, partial [Cnephaeus nilssonii]